MKLLVISHSCSTAINQQIYAEIARITNWHITIIVPRRWRDEFGGISGGESWPGFTGIIHECPVAFNGSIILHVYRTRLKQILETEKFDAIYVNHEPYALATAQVVRANSRSRNVPIGFYSCQNIIKKYPLPFRFLEQCVYRKCSFAFPITAEVASVLRDKGYQGDITICPLPFDPELYRLRTENELPASTRKKQGEALIGFVGRLTEAKGLRTFATALGKIKQHEWRLAIVGSGEFGNELRALLQKEGILDRCVHFGFVPHAQTPAYMSAFDILVLPSETHPTWKEQFGRVIPEALASGATVVGSDSGEIPNLIRKSGGGRIFPERNAGALAKELEILILDPELRANLAAEGRRWAVSEISIVPVASKMAAAIAKAVATDKAR